MYKQCINIFSDFRLSIESKLITQLKTQTQNRKYFDYFNFQIISQGHDFQLFFAKKLLFP